MSFIWIILQLFEEKTICYKSLEIYFEYSINLLTLKYHEFSQEQSSLKVIIGLNSTCENKHSMPTTKHSFAWIWICLSSVLLKQWQNYIAILFTNLKIIFKKVPPNVPLPDELP